MANSDLHSTYFLWATAHLTNNTIIKITWKYDEIIWTEQWPLTKEKLQAAKELVVKKEFTGPGLHLRPVCADRAWPPLQWTLSSVLSACGNDNGRNKTPPSGQGNLEEEKTDTNHPCLWTVSIKM